MRLLSRLATCDRWSEVEPQPVSEARASTAALDRVGMLNPFATCLERLPPARSPVRPARRLGHLVNARPSDVGTSPDGVPTAEATTSSVASPRSCPRSPTSVPDAGSPGLLRQCSATLAGRGARRFVDRPGTSGASWSTAQRAFEAGCWMSWDIHRSWCCWGVADGSLGCCRLASSWRSFE